MADQIDPSETTSSSAPWRNYAPPPSLNGYGRMLQMVLDQFAHRLHHMEREMDARGETGARMGRDIEHLQARMQVKRDRLDRIEREIADLRQQERTSWVAPVRPHAWKLLVASGLLLTSRLVTGTWPDPLQLVSRLLPG